MRIDYDGWWEETDDKAGEIQPGIPIRSGFVKTTISGRKGPMDGYGWVLLRDWQAEHPDQEVDSTIYSGAYKDRGSGERIFITIIQHRPKAAKKNAA